MPYRLPDADVVAIVDAPPPPATTLSPDGRTLLLVGYEAHPPVALLARPHRRLAGVRLDPALRGRQRTLRLTGLTLVDVASGGHRTVPLPPDAAISVPVWAPDSSAFAFTVDRQDGIGVWVGDPAAGTARELPGLTVSDTLTGGQLGGTGPVQWSRDSRTLLALAVPDPAPALPEEEIEPYVDETAGKSVQMATFQDLLTSPGDAALFAVLATTQLVRVDPATGTATGLTGPGQIASVDESPDGRYLLVQTLLEPYSYRVPHPYFARTVDVLAADGALVQRVAELPVRDEVPRHGVPTGPRQVQWLETAPADLLWLEALDGGDPMRPAEHRDRLLRLAPPFAAPARPVLQTTHRCLGWWTPDEPDRLLLVEHDRDRRWRTTWLRDLADDTASRVLFDLSADEAYADPGQPLPHTHRDGRNTVRHDGPALLLRGDGATPTGDRPFLDRFDPATGQAERRHLSPPDAVETVVGVTGDGGLLLRRESPTEPGTLLVAGPDGRRPLVCFDDPHPQLTGMTKALRHHTRPDGVPLSGVLHLPPGHDPERDGRLPLVLWAYPLDYGSGGTAGQVRGSDKGFTRLRALDPIWFVLRGYAVLKDATMPVVGDPETMNDTYLEQVTAAAAAHIAALDADGIVDPARVVVAGHSYGGFMTANLLAHSDLFAAGIARSGAYNRSLTPFGFQTERRSFWEAPGVYDALSPFRFADRISAPLLLVHGAADNNPGTFPIQSERLYQAIQGNGGTARLVLLPHESHGYLARESVLHVLAEQLDWADRWTAPGAESVDGERDERAE